MAFLGQAKCSGCTRQERDFKTSLWIWASAMGESLGYRSGLVQGQDSRSPHPPFLAVPMATCLQWVQLCWACPGQSCGILVLACLLPALA